MTNAWTLVLTVVVLVVNAFRIGHDLGYSKRDRESFDERMKELQARQRGAE